MISMIVYGTKWCPDCRRAKRFLDERSIPYRWVDIDQDPEAARYVIEINRGFRSVPTIVFEDGSVLTEPSDIKLARKLGIIKR